MQINVFLLIEHIYIDAVAVNSDKKLVKYTNVWIHLTLANVQMYCPEGITVDSSYNKTWVLKQTLIPEKPIW